MASKGKGRLSVTRETSTGRNTRFRDNSTGQEKSRAEVVRDIKNEKYPDYHVRNINGVATPVSNPDDKNGNNLG